MNDSARMGCLERFGNLLRDGKGFFERDSALRDPVREGRPVDEFHHERTDAGLIRVRSSRVFEAVDLSDVRVIERRKQLCLLLEPRQPFGIAREQIGQYLDRDVAIELDVASVIDLTHPARAEWGLCHVGTQA
jgi:hypothetical protein